MIARLVTRLEKPSFVFDDLKCGMECLGSPGGDKHAPGFCILFEDFVDELAQFLRSECRPRCTPK